MSLQPEKLKTNVSYFWSLRMPNSTGWKTEVKLNLHLTAQKIHRKKPRPIENKKTKKFCSQREEFVPSQKELKVIGNQCPTNRPVREIIKLWLQNLYSILKLKP